MAGGIYNEKFYNLDEIDKLFSNLQKIGYTDEMIVNTIDRESKLGLDIKSVSRWKNGNTVPTRYMDELEKVFGREFWAKHQIDYAFVCKSIPLRKLLLAVENSSDDLISSNEKRAFLLLVLSPVDNKRVAPGRYLPMKMLYEEGERYGYKIEKVKEAIQDLCGNKNFKGESFELLQYDPGKGVRLQFKGCETFLKCFEEEISKREGTVRKTEKKKTLMGELLSL